MVHISNTYLRASISNMGAEPRSLYNIESATEILWQQEGSFWGYTAPILFPIFGECCNNQYLCCDTPYTIPRHGFARILPFELISSTPTTATFSLSQSPETLAQYPFDFTLLAEYSLEGKKFTTTFTVINTGHEDLPFQLGSHPAFRFAIEDLAKCYILFDEKEPQLPPLSEDFRRLNVSDIPKDGKNSYSISNPNSGNVTLVTPEYKLKLTLAGISRIVIWRPTPDTPFVSIEPLVGGGDRKDIVFDIYERNGAVILKKGQEFSISSSITCE